MLEELVWMRKKLRRRCGHAAFGKVVHICAVCWGGGAGRERGGLRELDRRQGEARVICPWLVVRAFVAVPLHLCLFDVSCEGVQARRSEGLAGTIITLVKKCT